MTSCSYKYVFGPVPSRRLGRSLGVDLVPFKTCPYDCIYCQIGRTTVKTMERKEYAPVAEVLAELERKLAEGVAPDYITLSGSGEPTLHIKLGEIIAAAKRLSSVPLAVLTNGALLWDPDVRKDLAQADLVVPSLDAGEQTIFQAVNRPHPDLSFERMVDGLRMFRKEFKQRIHLEVFLLEGWTNGCAAVEQIARLAKEIAPEKIELNTVTRPPAETFALPVSAPQLRQWKDLFGERAEVISEALIPAGEFKSSALKEEILDLLARRPCTLEDLVKGLRAVPAEVVKNADSLLRANLAAVTAVGGKQYYLGTGVERTSQRLD